MYNLCSDTEMQNVKPPRMWTLHVPKLINGGESERRIQEKDRNDFKFVLFCCESTFCLTLSINMCDKCTYRREGEEGRQHILYVFVVIGSLFFEPSILKMNICIFWIRTLSVHCDRMVSYKWRQWNDTPIPKFRIEHRNNDGWWCKRDKYYYNTIVIMNIEQTNNNNNKKTAVAERKRKKNEFLLRFIDVIAIDVFKVS